MTEDRLEAIRQRVEKATPGPWTERGRDVDHDKDPDRDWGAGLGCEVEGPPEPQLRGQYRRHADATFVANAREDIPYLLAALAAVIEERDAALADAERQKQAVGDWAAEAFAARRERDQAASAERERLRQVLEEGHKYHSGLIPEWCAVCGIAAALLADPGA